MVELGDTEFREMYHYIRKRYGLNLERKKYLIESKLWIEIARSKSDSYAEYWKKLKNDDTGLMERRMMNLLTTNYSFFCREEEHFDFLCRTILPSFSAERKNTLKIWSAGCADGQECYTLAMKLLDCRKAGILRVPFEILGTDLSETAVAKAKKGLYGSAEYARLPQAWQMMYCENFQDGEFQVKDQLRSYITFQRQNLIGLPVMPPTYDVIFCRNVLIYFQDRERTMLIGRLTDALLEGGYLMIGHTESLLAIPNRLKYIQPAVYMKPEAKS